MITARNGAIGRSAEEGMPILRLFQGIRLASGGAAAGDTQPQTVGALRFEELRTAMSDNAAELFRPRGGDRREYTLDELWRLRSDPPEGIRRSDIVSELNVRLVQSLSVPVLPFLAIALSLGRRRSDRIYGIAAGLLILVGFNQTIDFGKNLVQGGDAGPALALWLPFAIFTVGSLYAFYRVAMRVPREISVPGLRALGDVARALRQRMSGDRGQPA